MKRHFFAVCVVLATLFAVHSSLVFLEDEQESFFESTPQDRMAVIHTPFIPSNKSKRGVTDEVSNPAENQDDNEASDQGQSNSASKGTPGQEPGKPQLILKDNDKLPIKIPKATQTDPDGMKNGAENESNRLDDESDQSLIGKGDPDTKKVETIDIGTQTDPLGKDITDLNNQNTQPRDGLKENLDDKIQEEKFQKSLPNSTDINDEETPSNQNKNDFQTLNKDIDDDPETDVTHPVEYSMPLDQGQKTTSLAGKTNPAENTEKSAASTKDPNEKEPVMNGGNDPNLKTNKKNDDPTIKDGTNSPVASEELQNLNDSELNNEAKPKKTQSSTPVSEDEHEKDYNESFDGDPSNLMGGEEDYVDEENVDSNSPLKQTKSRKRQPKSLDKNKGLSKKDGPQINHQIPAKNEKPDGSEGLSKSTLPMNEVAKDSEIKSKPGNQSLSLPNDKSEGKIPDSTLAPTVLENDPNDSRDKKTDRSYDMTNKEAQDLIEMLRNGENIEDVENLLENGMYKPHETKTPQDSQQQPNGISQNTQGISNGHPLLMTHVKHNGHPHPKDPSKDHKKHPLVISTAIRHKHPFDPELPMPIKLDFGKLSKTIDDGKDITSPLKSQAQISSNPNGTHRNQPFGPYGKRRDNADKNPGLLSNPALAFSSQQPPYDPNRAPKIQIYNSVPQKQNLDIQNKPALINSKGLISNSELIKDQKVSVSNKPNEKLKESLQAQDPIKIAEMSKQIKEAHQKAEAEHLTVTTPKATSDKKQGSLLTKQTADKNEKSKNEPQVVYAKNPFECSLSFIVTGPIVALVGLLFLL